ncbi:hypothetical protein CDAR_533211 [Caerostris darwini]|uniref:Uncharacterized protein n=1 Tax=Caerostris darwini TaxID=1538125 RepID=A0AAV4SFF5_9ARAC|nr:hypothetical protein CDAR_533211 [Caerostris darwini]
MKYLGVAFSLKRSHTVGFKEKLEMWIEKIEEFRGFKPDQRVPRLLHILKQTSVSGVAPAELDRLLRRNVKEWYMLPPSWDGGSVKSTTVGKTMVEPVVPT